MRIQKDNIVIRSATIDDAVQLNKWWNDGRVMEHAGFPNGLGESLEDTMNNIRSWEGKLSQLCVIEIDGKPVGELSYRIKDDNAAYPGWKICDFSYQNRGYGPKIIRMVFNRTIPSVLSWIFIIGLVIALSGTLLGLSKKNNK